jgi:hypothetical protein
VDESAWLDAFVMAMNRLGATAPPNILGDMGKEYYLTHGKFDPVKIAKWRVEHFGAPGGQDSRALVQGSPPV